MLDYTKSKIYLIRNFENDFVFVGATTQRLSKRWGSYKENWKKDKMGSLYDAFNDVGYEQFYIELYKNVNCKNIEELRKHQADIIRLYNNKAYNTILSRARTLIENLKNND